jgi:hypothetical protein
MKTTLQEKREMIGSKSDNRARRSSTLQPDSDGHSELVICDRETAQILGSEPIGDGDNASKQLSSRPAPTGHNGSSVDCLVISASPVTRPEPLGTPQIRIKGKQYRLPFTRTAALQ